jgi:hypothetical protein
VAGAVIKAYCNNGTVTARVTKPSSIQYHYTYTTGHQWNETTSRWDPVTFQCSGNVISNSWCTANAEVLVNATRPYVIAYTCTWVNNQWKCGCRDQSCSPSYWQLQKFQL